ncbi:MAG: carbamoyltransferase [Flavobacteriales bacterium]|nr:carbamoyltransferase [Flavobacteriales bacterium]|tara:strand:- start:36093 stop:37817 length:1725 start_codon:yes stop_codon:yes gene_type:complete
MYILGINAYHGDSSACLLKDGVVVCAIEEERILRIKHWAGFPSKAIQFCLEDAGITIQDVDHITISRDLKANFYKKIFYTFYNRTNLSAIWARLKNFRKVNAIKSDLANLFKISEFDIKADIHNIEHHRSHISSSFFASSFKKSAILSIDGFGDFTSTMTAFGNDNKLNILKEVNYPHSLGLFYTAVTQFLGFSNYGDEYKVMGLAPYGNPKYLKKLEKIIKLTDEGFFKLDKKYFKHFKDGVAMEWEGGSPNIDALYTKDWEDLFGRSRLKGEELEQWHIDLAASAQKITERVVFHILNNLQKETGCDNICIAGGVAQNSVINGKILENTNFKNIYIPSAGNDAGTSIGSALYLYNHIFRNERMPEIISAYFGSRYDNQEVLQALEKEKSTYKILSDEDLFDTVVDKLLSGGVIGWFQGRSEFGSRALGHRSILVDPRRKDAKDLLNKKIKRRESFRPFAPSILKEYVKEYFVQDSLVPFMEKVFEIRKEKQEKIPAVCHIDGTGRLQSVDKKISPRYHRLISKFAEKTGVPILLNTSFNENEPIVNTPVEALNCFKRTKMDMLVIENIIIER